MEQISNSNNKNVFTLQNLYDFYQPNQGFLYCLHNEIFKFYGNDLYKCGNSIVYDRKKIKGIDYRGLILGWTLIDNNINN